MKCESVYAGIRKCVINDYPFFIEWNDELIFPVFQECFDEVIDQHSHIDNPYYSNGEEGVLRIEYLDHYVIITFRFAYALNKYGMKKVSEAVYYSCRVRGSIDLFYTTNIGRCFMPVHAIGTVIDSHAKYGDFFKIYDGCHIGPFSIVGKNPGEWEHPSFGNYVTMLGHAKVYGKSIVGDNVIISTETVIINEEIPSNCIVSGKSPNLIYQKLRVSNKDIEK